MRPENTRIRRVLEEYDSCVTKCFFGTKDGVTSRIARFHSHYLEPFQANRTAKGEKEERDLDSEDEEGLAYHMFVDDVDKIRRVMLDAVNRVMNDKIILEDRFVNEREFYSKQIAK